MINSCTTENVNKYFKNEWNADWSTQCFNFRMVLERVIITIVDWPRFALLHIGRANFGNSISLGIDTKTKTRKCRNNIRITKVFKIVSIFRIYQRFRKFDIVQSVWSTLAVVSLFLSKMILHRLTGENFSSKIVKTQTSVKTLINFFHY